MKFLSKNKAKPHNLSYYSQTQPLNLWIVFISRLEAQPDGKKALLTLANGDMRKILNILQSTSLAFNKQITEENVYNCVGHPLKNDIENIVKWLLTEPMDVAYKSILFIDGQCGAVMSATNFRYRSSRLSISLVDIVQ